MTAFNIDISVLEPQTEQFVQTGADIEAVKIALALSTAISTKRIADFLEKNNLLEIVHAAGLVPLNQYGEGLLEGIQGSIRRGMQGVE